MKTQDPGIDNSRVLWYNWITKGAEMEFTKIINNTYTTRSERTGETYTLGRPSPHNATCTCPGFRHSKTNACKHTKALMAQTKYEAVVDDGQPLYGISRLDRVIAAIDADLD